MHLDALLIVATGLALAHYAYLGVRWFSGSWGIRRGPSYRPRITVVIPMYNELVKLRLLPKLDGMSRR
jgi:biofilm PGA synthesis N-glycosyltransferase PgaC